MIRQIKRIVITGPTGAIGRALIDLCLAQGIYVVLIVHKDSKRIADLPVSEYISMVYADITEYDSVEITEENRNCDAFIHLAWMGTVGDARNDMELQMKNIAGAISAVGLANRMGCQLFMGAGSQAEYGRTEGYLRPDTPAFPENGYGMAKLCAGQMSRVVCEQLGMEHIWLRVLSIYGPYDGEKSMVMSAINSFINNREIAFTKGEQKWDYLFNRDAAKMIYRLLQSGKHGKVYCIGSGKERMLKEYIRDIYYAVAQEDAQEADIGIGKIPYADKQVMFLCADISELEADIGTVELTPFVEGIKETVEWFRNRG